MLVFKRGAYFCLDELQVRTLGHISSSSSRRSSGHGISKAAKAKSHDGEELTFYRLRLSWKARG